MALKSRLSIVASFKNATPHYYDSEGNKLFFSSKNRIYAIRDLGRPKPDLMGEVPWTVWQRATGFRLADRFLKHSILQLGNLPGKGWLVLTGHSWWRLAIDGAVLPVAGVSQTRPMARGLETAGDSLYLGEYFDNPERGPVRILRTRDLATFITAWEFPAKSIRHVHALVADPETAGRIWVLTGDLDEESHFYYTDDEFASLHKVLSLGQKSRAVDLTIRQGTLIWGMDSPVETSSILSAKIGDPTAIMQHCELPGPAYYACRNQAGGLYIGTTVEPGPAIKDGRAHIFGLQPDGTWQDMLALRKDVVPQFGIIYFPRGNLPQNYLVFAQRALLPGEGRMTIARDSSI